MSSQRSYPPKRLFFLSGTTKALSIGLFLFSSSAVLAQTSQVFYGPAGQANPTDFSSYSARTSVFGPGFTGIADDSSALLSNPAGLATLERGSAALHSYFGLMDAAQEDAIVGFPLESGVGVGLAVNYMNYGTFEGRDAIGSLAPDYSADRIGLQVGWGKRLLPEFSLGLALHYYQQDLPEKTYSYVIPDIGVLLDANRGFKLGLDYLSPGLGSVGVTLVSIFKAGASQTIALDSTTRFLAALGNSLQSNGLDYLQGGVEASYQSRYFLRAGYRVPFNDNAYGGFSNVTFGAGLVLMDFALDYAYSPSGNISDSNRFSLSYFFDQPEGKGPSVHTTALSGEGNSSSVLPSKKPISGRMYNSQSGKPAPFGLPQTAMSTGRVPPGSTQTAGPSGLGTGTLPDNPGVSIGITAASSSASNPSAAVTVYSPTSGPPGVTPRAETQDDSQKSLALHFEIPTDYTSQGDQMEAQGKHKEAVQLYKEAVEEDPQNVQAWWNMGNVYYKLALKDYAVACFEKVLKLRPDNQDLKKWLDNYKAQKP